MHGFIDLSLSSYESLVHVCQATHTHPSTSSMNTDGMLIYLTINLSFGTFDTHENSHNEKLVNPTTLLPQNTTVLLAYWGINLIILIMGWK